MCGSCWAFSAVGTIEGAYNVENNCPACNKDLSEQQLVSDDGICCGNCGNCNGGWPHLAFSYIHSTGVCDEGCFPYKARTSPCNLCQDYSRRVWKIDSFGKISDNLDEIKRAVICYGPISVASMNWLHAIVLVGYDDDREVWIIRNSWGSSWGDRGYGYIPYTGHPYSDLKEYVWYVKGVRGP
jgi:cathepsin L